MAAAHLLDEKKALDVRVYNVENQIKIADYFVVAAATARPHVKALYNELHVRLKAAGELHAKAEGLDTGWWVLLDYLDVVIHIQQGEAREYYGLDDLYGDCPQLDWRAEGMPNLSDSRGDGTKDEQGRTA